MCGVIYDNRHLYNSFSCNRLDGYIRSVAGIGYIARHVLNDKPSRCMINVSDFEMWNRYPGTFANAVLCGILCDESANTPAGIQVSLLQSDFIEKAELDGLIFAIREDAFPGASQCSVNIAITGKRGREAELTGSLLANGAILISSCILHM